MSSTEKEKLKDTTSNDIKEDESSSTNDDQMNFIDNEIANSPDSRTFLGNSVYQIPTTLPATGNELTDDVPTVKFVNKIKANAAKLAAIPNTRRYQCVKCKLTFVLPPTANDLTRCPNPNCNGVIFRQITLAQWEEINANNECCCVIL